MSIFFKSVVADGETTYLFTTAGYVLFICLLIAALMVASLFKKNGKRQAFSTKQLAFSSVSIALAFVTSNIKFFDLPFGGSITLFSMFFMCFIGYLYGTRSGITAGIAYGLLQLLIDPYVLSLPQLTIDYFLAFGALGLSGLFSHSKYGLFKGYIAGITGRFIFAVLSGVIFFGMYAPEGMNPLLYSVIYNGSYIYAEGAATCVIMAVPAVRKMLIRIKIMANEQTAEIIEDENKAAA